MSDNIEQHTGAFGVVNRIDLLGGMFAAMACCFATLGTLSSLFPWWLGWEWTWWDWDLSGFNLTSENIYSGLAVMLFSVLGWICSFIGVVSAIVGVKERSLMIPRLILFAGAIVAIIALLDLGYSLGADWLKPGFGIVLALGSGIGLIVTATGMAIAFGATYRQSYVKGEKPGNGGKMTPRISIKKG